jgi:microcystin degradation protein MlrC
VRVFTAAFYSETNTFSPRPMGWSSFREQMLYRPGEHPDYLHEVTCLLYLCRKRARAHSWDVVEGTCAYAKPAGPVSQVVYESIRDEILGQIGAALPLDAVALGMHGAMVATGEPDCEGDVVERIRRLTGPRTKIGLLLDPHCHMSARMTENCDAIVLMKEYPHVDFAERGEELLDILSATASGEIRPHMAIFDCRMIDFLATAQEPMRSFVEKVKQLEGQDGILSISVVHGCDVGDVPDMGTRILVVTDDRPATGARVAEELGRELFAMRGRSSLELVSMEHALERASCVGKGPLILADMGDVPGGGAPGDATYLLRAILERGIRDVCATLYDPMAVRFALDAGEGQTLEMRIGGKMGAVSGDPLDVRASITALAEDATQSFAGSRLPLGDCAALNFDGVDVVLTSVCEMTLGVDLFSNLGIDPARRRVVAVKSGHAFKAGYSGIAAEILHVDTPGALVFDIRGVPYRNIARPKWPFDDDPFGVAEHSPELGNSGSSAETREIPKLHNGPRVPWLR